MSSRHLPGGGGNRRPWSAHVDLYRKIPTDLMEGTNRGSIMSYLSLLVMVILFLWETSAFFQTKMVTDLALDYKRDPGDVNADDGNNKKKTKNADIEFGGLLARNPNAYADHIRLNFNITMTDLSCDFAVIDVVSVLGTDQNVTAHITKWNIVRRCRCQIISKILYGYVFVTLTVPLIDSSSLFLSFCLFFLHFSL